MNIIMYFSVAAVKCGPIQTWAGLQTNNTGVDLKPGLFLRVSCQEGLTFPNKVLYMETVCSDTGDWEPPLLECIGKKQTKITI